MQVNPLDKAIDLKVRNTEDKSLSNVESISNNSKRKNTENPNKEEGIPKAKNNKDAVVVEISNEQKRPENPEKIKDSSDNNVQERTEALIKEKREESQAKIREEQKEQGEVKELKKRDREVRSHEQAHKSVLGPYANGGIQLQFTRGPDGGQYAVSGEVGVDLSKESDPKTTIKKAQTVRRAALAPKDPSSADRQIASQASQLEQQARVDLRKEQQEEGSAGGSNSASSTSSLVQNYGEEGKGQAQEIGQILNQLV